MVRRSSKSPSRVELRKQAEAAEKLEASGDAPVKKVKAKAKKKATRRTSKSKAKAAAERMRMVWGIFDGHNQQVATFPYPERSAADAKCEELTQGKGRGPYFVQPVREPYPEPEPEVEEA
ncbi:hypothetical protein Pan216_14730 [Planctomycetes bacterium Pan216]|uniref:Uncharacterized protein n=1 Tax=Kolteria novifilia TaxID=2527975 RepID=A0A518B0X2_9BACT|nr:hypothetical protein Pan216_14730 [Planctomycetes bacterium Pan216]